MRKILFVILAGSGLFATQAIAQDYGKVYLGLGVGKTTLKTNLDLAPGFTNLTTVDEASTVNVFIGYSFNKNLSIEGGLTSTGQATSNTSSSDGIRLKTETDMRSIELVAKGTLPIGKFELFARGGMIYGDTNYDMTLELPDEMNPAIRNENRLTENSQKAGLIVGAGAGYNFGRAAIRLQYDLTRLDMKASNEVALYTSDQGQFVYGTADSTVSTKNPKRLMLTVSGYF